MSATGAGPRRWPAITEVADSLTPKEIEVKDRDGHWYSMRIRPYKTAEDRIDGSVLTLVDIDELKSLRDLVPR